jgi:hypothetical protein
MVAHGNLFLESGGKAAKSHRIIKPFLKAFHDPIAGFGFVLKPTISPKCPSRQIAATHQSSSPSARRICKTGTEVAVTGSGLSAGIALSLSG